MIWVDYLIILVFAASVLLGIWRGFTREVFSLLTWILAFAAAWLLSPAVEAPLQPHLADPVLREAAACAIVFFAVLVIGVLLTHVLVAAVRDSGFTPADRTLGGGLGLIRAVVLVSFFVVVAGRMGADDDRWWRQSSLLAGFMPLARGFESVIPQRWLDLLKPAAPPSQSAGQ